MEEDKDDRHALLERVAKLMVKAGYSAYAVKIKVAGKEKSYGFMEPCLCRSRRSSSWSSISRLGLTIPPSVLGRADQVIE